MNAHTPGPWDYWLQPTKGTYRIRHAIDGNRIIVGVITKKANACLIASAPEMLALLKEAEELLNDHYSDIDNNGNANGAMRLVLELRVLIAKAEGRS